MERLPVSISPCPVQEAVVEVRFSSILPAEAVFGVLYTKVNHDFGSVTNLPILQIPEAIRSQDPNLMYQAHYSLSKGNLSLKVGPRVLTFSYTPPYEGWHTFLPFVLGVLDSIKDTGIIQLPERIGIRYINFFSMPILDKLKLELKYGETRLSTEATHVRTEILEDGFIKIINVANNMSVTLQGRVETGSLVDIDCVYNYPLGSASFYESHESIIEEGHKIEKRTFFGLLQDEFLNTLSPNY